MVIDGQKNVQLAVSESLHRCLKSVASKNGKTMKDYIIEALEAKFKKDRIDVQDVEFE